PYELIATVPVDYWPQAIWASPDGKYVLVANFGFDFSYDHCSVIRTSDWQVIARLQTGAGPEDMVSIGDEGQYLYVSNWGMPCCFATAWDFCCSASPDQGTASIIALPDFDAIVPPGTIPDTIPYIKSTLATVPLNAIYSFGMATHPDGSQVYAVNKDSHTLSVIGFESTVPVPEGEHCGNAIALSTLTGCVEGTTLCFHDNTNEICPFPGAGGSDIVYAYTPSMGLTGSIDLCDSEFDTKVYIYEDNCTDSPVYCNDDYCGVNGWRSHLEDISLSSGHTYYIVVDGFGSADKGQFQMCFDMHCASDITGDGIVNVQDLLVLVTGYGSTYNLGDLLQFLGDFGAVCDL
ncbi:MAG: hypothetical protein JNM00_03845, partial [Flavobacteriales bacterium]|nr:hypothetical protein [Flavobacteriales bacterium]